MIFTCYRFVIGINAGKCYLYLDSENDLSFSYNDPEDNSESKKLVNNEIKGDTSAKYNFVEIKIKLEDLQNENFNFDDEDRKIRLQLEDGKNYKQTKE